jgi:hypothetical protein
MAFLLCILLWNAGSGIISSGLQYDLFRNQFSKGLMILIAVIVFSLIYSDNTIINNIGRFSIIYLVINPMLLRSVREYEYVKAQRSKKADTISVAINISIALILILITSNKFLSLIYIGGRYVFNALDRLLSAVLYVILLPIGYLLMPLINALARRIKLDPDTININIKGDTEKLPVNEGLKVPPAVATSIKIVIAVAIVVVLIKLYSVYVRRNRKADYTESREFEFSMDDLRNNFKAKLSSVLSSIGKRIRPRPYDLREKIRYIFTNYLDLSVKKGIYSEVSQTHRDLEIKTVSVINSEAGIKKLTDTYEKARYSQYDVSEEDYENARQGFAEIKEKY